METRHSPDHPLPLLYAQLLLQANGSSIGCTVGNPVVDQPGCDAQLVELCQLFAIKTDKAIEFVVVVGLIAHVGRGNLYQCASLKKRLAGTPQMRVTHIDL